MVQMAKTMITMYTSIDTLTPAALLLRVSTCKQSTQRQENDLRAIAQSKGFKVHHVIIETVSGAAKQDKREGLQELLELAREGTIKLVACTEVSRLGRSTALVLSTIERLHDLGVGVYVDQFQLWSLTRAGEQNPMSSFFLQMLSAFAELERNTLKDRIRSGIARYQAEGGKMGRPLGSIEDLKHKHEDIMRFLLRGYTYQEIRRLTARSSATVAKVAQLLTTEEAQLRKDACFNHRYQEAIYFVLKGGTFTELIVKFKLSNGTAAKIMKKAKLLGN